MNIPQNLTKGRAAWIWQKMHAMQFNAEDARFVLDNFGSKLYSIPYEGQYLLCNSAGCFIAWLTDDNDPYIG